MKLRTHGVAKTLIAATALACAASAAAQSAGKWTAKFGFGELAPKVESGDLSAPALPFTRIDVKSDIQPVLVVAYGVTDNISLEAALGTPYKHKLLGAGSIAGTGELGTVEALRPALFAQYRFLAPGAAFRPFVGIGATYTYFMKESGSGRLTALTNPGGPPTTFEIDDKFSYTAQAGMTMHLSERWFADVSVNKSRLRTDVRYSTGQRQHLKLDPVAVALAVGYKF